MANISDIDPDGDGLVDVVPRMAEIRRDSPSRPFLAAPGTYRCGSPLPVLGEAPLSIYGVGSNGAGPATYDYKHSVLFVPSFAEGDLFAVSTPFPCWFENFRIEPEPQYRPGVGAGIHVRGTPAATNANTVFRNVAVVAKDIGIRQVQATGHLLEHCYFEGWRSAGILNETSSQHEGNPGWYTHNRFFGNAGNPAAIADRGPCLLTETGYARISENLIVGGRVGIHVAIKNRPGGAPLISGNWIEDQWEYGILVESLDGQPCSMLAIEANELSVIEARPSFTASICLRERTDGRWLKQFAIRANTIRNNLSNSNGKFIWVQAGLGGKIHDNSLNNLSAGPRMGVQLTGSATNDALAPPIEATGNQFLSESGRGFTYLYSVADGIARIEHKQGVTVADLTAKITSPADGSEVYVLDGKARSTPISGGGTGTLARRVDGAWVGT
ncbi:MAG: hypothetical protein JO048_12275 [Methylobacteriaceae bacterium]|nr:hypothetical protein [Methylobacteriaceae bacterium]